VLDLESSGRQTTSLTSATPPLLLVDQEVGSRAVLRQALGARGFEVSSRQQPGSTTAVAERPFAFVLGEMRLGDGNGLALVEQLRRRDEAMRIVVVTARVARPSATSRSGAADLMSLLPFGVE
jgi:ActR/RegA family two-component response regulator